MNFNKSLIKLQDAISSAVKNNISLNYRIDEEKAMYDYREKQRIYYINNLNSSLRLVKSCYMELTQLARHDIRNQPYINRIMELIPELEDKSLEKLGRTTNKIISITKQLNFPKKELEKAYAMPDGIPEEISGEIKADISELNRCFSNSCYRSSIIICGRIMETALHRKYYEVTNNDLLEKSPGIGLGNIIAKLKEKEIKLDPALTNQIHLINQVRVFSVHKKKEAFYPTRQQTEATILYTLDVLERLFN
ncbi:DUF4145 domain-containing protein [Candidatus Woesearchaeota archaeon]|nr:DUF4145 domain-containing protein [Candidatus Woesearchaeota archaeon]